MKMKPLNIFGKEVSVEMADLTQWNLHACFYSATNEIKIDPKSDEKFSSYCHEIGHALWHRMGFNQTSIPHDLQEIIVEAFANAFVENFETILKTKKSFEKP